MVFIWGNGHHINTLCGVYCPAVQYTLYMTLITDNLRDSYKDLNEKCNGLHGFSETHLIGKDAVLTSVPVEEEPVYPV